jgi:hypothetical protein
VYSLCITIWVRDTQHSLVGLGPHGTKHRQLARQGFYWPTAVSDAVELVRSCKGCQYYARQTHLPTHALQTIPITWLFAVWGLDLVEPLKRTTGGFTHLPGGTRFSSHLRCASMVVKKNDRSFMVVVYDWTVLTLETRLLAAARRKSNKA